MTRATLHSALDRLDRVDAMMRDRATQASGLGAARNVWHNAVIAAQDGRPWRGVDYSRLRLALRIENRRFTILSDLRRRLYLAV